MKHLVWMFTLLASSNVFASEMNAGYDSSTSYKVLGYFLGLSIAVLGGTLGQSRAVAAALEGLARNPNAYDKVFTPFILGLAFMESLVIFILISWFIAK